MTVLEDRATRPTCIEFICVSWRTLEVRFPLHPWLTVAHVDLISTHLIIVPGFTLGQRSAQYSMYEN